jgi:ankyrin repeat protein
MARLLIALGADPTLPNSLGQTALAYAHAWAQRHVPLLDLLIKEGCDPDAVEGQVQEAMRGNSYGIHAMRYY